MNQNGVAAHRYRRSPSNDRFIGVFSHPSETTFSSSPSAATGDELNEDDVFYNNDFSERQQRNPSGISHSLRRSENFGILAALPERQGNLDGQFIVRKPAIPSSSTTPFSRAMPSIPKPHSSLEVKNSQSLPARRFHQSAPVNVPMFPRKQRSGEVSDVDHADEGDDDEMLPPHEIVARGSTQNQKNTFSVLEGVGRTLKGRDLRQVRNAVWQQTGFLD
ncbi:protein S40-7-like [Primulina huaijiensis]|uniref:protein S40-7-like n=1 Tax=Primulina huaijiensis TaxID=1492673 RepID=UPI003CC77514